MVPTVEKLITTTVFSSQWSKTGPPASRGAPAGDRLTTRRQKPSSVSVSYQYLDGAWHELGAGVEHDLSELLQHEIDHLDGS